MFLILVPSHPQVHLANVTALALPREQVFFSPEACGRDCALTLMANKLSFVHIKFRHLVPWQSEHLVRLGSHAHLR